jgi:Tol biopolymer transport system component
MRPVIGDVATPWVSPTPTPTPLPIPQELVGKIIFLSDRSGGPQPLPEPLVYVVDPDGSNLAVLTDYTFYNTALARDTYSADQQYRAFVKERDGVPAIFYLDYHDNLVQSISLFDVGQGAWDPVWSPTQEQIAFVSDASGDDEIWIANRDGSGLRRLTETNEEYNAREAGKDTFVPEVNGHPSWSPDGSKIVFWSNRTGHEQIWVMNADGSNPYLLSPSGYNDWNPIWIKHTDPAREAVFGIGEISSVSAQSNP